jgi:hypothetical protein
MSAARDRALKGELAPAIEAMIWAYAKGKPREHVEVDGGLTISWETT